MKIIEYKGFELEKERPNTSEDFFNRSEVSFIDGSGQTKTFHLLYVRYFDQIKNEYTIWNDDPIFTVNNQEVLFRDIVALVGLIANPEYKNQKRVYINSIEEFSALFKNAELTKIPEIITAINNGGYVLT